MKILLGQSYHRILDPKELKRNMPYPPLGPLYIATILRDLGYEIIFHDGMIATSTDELQNIIVSSKPDLLLLYDDEFNYLTKMCLTNMRELAFDCIKTANELNIPVFVYNSDAMDHADLYLSKGSDIVLNGEGEQTVLELLKHFDAVRTGNDELIKSIKGLYFRNTSQHVIFSGSRDLLDDLNQLPDPDYTITNIDHYKKIWLKKHKYFSLNISTTRGCPYSCNWCAKPLWGRTYSMFSPERIVSLIEKLYTTYNVDHIWITDDIFGLKYSWLEDFSLLMCQKNIKLKRGIKCLSRADLLIKKDTLSLLEKSGISNVWIGAESGSQVILDRMDKNIEVDQIYETINLSKSLNLRISFFIQFGYLYETWNDILMTRRLIKTCLPDDIGISVSYPLPGTKFHAMVSDLLTQKTNWTDSDDLDLMFLGNFPSKFYKILHRFVHAEYNITKMVKGKNLHKIYFLPYYSLLYVYFRLRLQPYLQNSH